MNQSKCTISIILVSPGFREPFLNEFSIKNNKLRKYSYIVTEEQASVVTNASCLIIHMVHTERQRNFSALPYEVMQRFQYRRHSSVGVCVTVIDLELSSLRD